jgi:uncharacterized protein YcbK (DUF882 family)
MPPSAITSGLHRAAGPQNFLRATWSLAIVALLVGAALTAPEFAAADRQHVVREGQSLARIATRYAIPVSQLAAANGLTLNDQVRPGQVLTVPERGVVYVRSGQTLARIARNHDVSVDALATQNRLRPDAALRVGQKLLLPGFEAAQERDVAEHKWGRPRRPGTATFYRIWSQESERIRLVDAHGRVRRVAVDRLKHLMRPKSSRKKLEPHRRLVSLLAQVSDHFGGRTIQIVSGYRLTGGNTRESSRHVSGDAMDLRVQGVPVEVVRDYCRTFGHVGVGYYPRTHFVHLDVRRESAYWVDWAAAGEAPRRSPGQRAAVDDEVQDEPPSADDGQPPVDDEPSGLSDE